MPDDITPVVKTPPAAPPVVETPPAAPPVVETPPATPPVVETPPPAAPPTSLSEYIPEEYRSNTAVIDILSQENPGKALVERLLSLNDIIANNPEKLPGADATPEQIAKWVELAQPKDIAEYGQIKPTLTAEQAHLAGFLDAGYTPEFVSEITMAARDAGIQPWQLQKLTNVFNGIQIKSASQFLETQAQQELQLNSNFDNVMNTTFGADKMKALEIGKNTINQILPPEMKAHVDTLSNEALAVVASLAYNMHKKYGLEDTITPGASTGMPSDEVGVKNAIQQAMSDPAVSNPWDANHDAANKKVMELSQQLARVQGRLR